MKFLLYFFDTFHSKISAILISLGVFSSVQLLDQFGLLMLVRIFGDILPVITLREVLWTLEC